MTAMDSHMNASDGAGPDSGTEAATEPVTADQLVSDLYHAHGLAMVRIAVLLVGDKPTAEDVVQDAFAGLYRMSDRLNNPERAVAYLRVSVVNGCRSVHRARRVRARQGSQHEPAVWSAEAAVIAREDSRLMLQAVARLPRRSREVLGLRYYLDLPDTQIAETLGISRGTVSSTASRALAALARLLREES